MTAGSLLQARTHRRHRTTSSLSLPIDVQRRTFYTERVIRSFRCKKTEALFGDQDVAAFRAFERSARRKLLLLHRARTLQDLMALPGNRLEALLGERAGQYSIRINNRWRLCFSWKEGEADAVEIVDYH